jgi:hypothetical protein
LATALALAAAFLATLAALAAALALPAAFLAD